MDHGSEPKRQIRKNVDAGDDFEHRQRGNGRKRMMKKLERHRSGPCAFNSDILADVAHQLADARCAIHVRDDLQQKTRGGERREDR